jgi:iron(III) transport system substrate-binding protein
MLIVLTLVGLTLSACVAAPVVAPIAATDASSVPPLPTALPLTAEDEAWLKTAELDPYAPAKQDWAAIEAAARQEGKVVYYSMSAFAPEVGQRFHEKYPEIEVEAYYLGATGAFQRLREEQQAGVYAADVYFSMDLGNTTYEIVPQHYLWNFIPDDFVDQIPAQYREPFLILVLNGRILIYNSELNPSCPISNWWDLTEPAWKGKFMVADPTAEAAAMNFLTTAVLHSDALSQAYQEKYGQAPTLDSDTPNAGYLWIKRLAANQPVLVPGNGKTAENVGTKGIKEAPVGMDGYAFYRRVTKGELAFEPCLGVKPVLGTNNRAFLAIANRAPHPNAAKLFLRYLLTAEGNQPMRTPGTYWTVQNLPEPEGNIPQDQYLAMTWQDSPDEIYRTLPAVRDFWLSALTR